MPKELHRSYLVLGLAWLGLLFSSLFPVYSFPDLVPALESNRDAVVKIQIVQRTDSNSRHDPLFADLDTLLSDAEDRHSPGKKHLTASGIIADKNGLIVTSAHALANASRIKVKLAGQDKWRRAKVVQQRADIDVAIIKINASNLSPARFGSTHRLKIGQWVMTIGAPFGFEGSASVGIISALNRTLDINNGNGIGHIQSDVASNPGNSGGPLLSVDGEVIGMITHIYTQSGGYQGVSFAVPVEHILEMIPSISPFPVE